MNQEKSRIKDLSAIQRTITKKELAEYYNVSLETLRTWLKEEGIYISGNLKPYQIKTVIEKIGNDRKAMRTRLELAAYYQVNVATITAWLKRAGIKKKGGQFKPSEMDKILEHLGRW